MRHVAFVACHNEPPHSVVVQIFAARIKFVASTKRQQRLMPAVVYATHLPHIAALIIVVAARSVGSNAEYNSCSFNSSIRFARNVSTILIAG